MLVMGEGWGGDGTWWGGEGRRGEGRGREGGGRVAMRAADCCVHSC